MYKTIWSLQWTLNTCLGSLTFQPECIQFVTAKTTFLLTDESQCTTSLALEQEEKVHIIAKSSYNAKNGLDEFWWCNEALPIDIPKLASLYFVTN